MTLPAAMLTHLFVYPGADLPSSLPEGIRASLLPAVPADTARAVADVLRDSTTTTIACWDLRLAPLPWLQLARFASSLDDAWHPGARLTAPDDDLLRYVLPLWAHRPSPVAELAGAINWRLDLRACFLRASVVRELGGLDGQFETLAGAARELGLRMIRRGAICRQQPALWAGPTSAAPPSAADRYRLVGRVSGKKWQAYALARSVIDGQPVRSEWRAWRSTVADEPTTKVEIGALHRPIDDVALPDRVSVTVVLPTYGRYRYLAEVLEDVRAQTIRPTQILICDNNEPEDRDHKLYERYRDLPIEVIWDEHARVCSARNVCLQRATGDYIWFVDDDSRFAPDNLESHLRVLGAYGADVSVGPAYTPWRAELHGEQREVACTFMDCGTTLCKKQLLDTVGGFDLQFDELFSGEDGELGVRFVRAGGLMVNNPFAKRFHYLAPAGGCRRSKNNLHRRSRWSLLPRPSQSIYYTALRHFERGVGWDAVLFAGLLVGWRRHEKEPATLRWRARTLLGELAALPLTAYRMRKSIKNGEAMFQEGAQVPPLSSARSQPLAMR